MSEPAAALSRELNPVRLQHSLFSDRNPWLWSVAALAEAAQRNRQPVPADNPFLKLEREVSHNIESWLNAYRDLRDTNLELWFKSAYGPLGLGMLCPPRDGRKVAVESAAEQGFAARAAQLRAVIAEGGC